THHVPPTSSVVVAPTLQIILSSLSSYLTASHGFPVMIVWVIGTKLPYHAKIQRRRSPA
ncbi:hypothetical protein L9F63_016863, partial [Diploptera punctata]